MKATITLNVEAGNLPTWAEQEATRLSKLPSFQARGWNAVGVSAVYRKLNKALETAGIKGNYRDRVAGDICDLARLKANAEKN